MSLCKGQIPSKHKTFVYHLYNVGQTSPTLVQHCTNVIQIICVYWVPPFNRQVCFVDVTYGVDSATSSIPSSMSMVTLRLSLVRSRCTAVARVLAVVEMLVLVFSDWVCAEAHASHTGRSEVSVITTSLTAWDRLYNRKYT